MTHLRLGSLCTGYGGLDMAVAAATGAQLAWVADVCKFNKDGTVGHHSPHRGPCALLAHHYPHVPNLGDISVVDWAEVEPVEVLCAGTPCQDLSHAGRRAGMSAGTRSNLWVAMREAIAILRPRLVVWENVRGAYSASADSELECRPGLLDQVRRRGGEPVLRALGRVAGDLADLGYDAQWVGIPAAAAGAPHLRFRCFLTASPADAERIGLEGPQPQQLEDDERPWVGDHRGEPLLPTPRTSDTNGAGRHGSGGPYLRTVVSGLLPTPTVRDEKDHMIRREPHRPDDVDTLSRALTVLLPTPRAGDGEKGGPNQRGSSGDLMLPSAVLNLLPTPNGFHAQNTESPEEWLTRRADVEERTGTRHGPALPVVAWSITDGHPLVQDGGGPRLANATPDVWGPYSAAVHRWEDLTRVVPPPTELGPKGKPRLAAAFTEWMMGLPAGWVTDVPGLTRNEMLKLCGNGVVPQQALLALWLMAQQVGA